MIVFFFFQAEDGIRDLVRSRGLGDVYKRQSLLSVISSRFIGIPDAPRKIVPIPPSVTCNTLYSFCLLYTSDAADERSSVDLGGRRIIKKKKQVENTIRTTLHKYIKHIK